MTGSLQIKDGKYYTVINTYENGKRRQKWENTGLSAKGNKRAAEKLLRERLRGCEETKARPTAKKNDVLFADYVRFWLKQVSRKVDQVTYEGYEGLARAHVLPYFDAKKYSLQKISTEDLQAYFDKKASSGRLDGGGALSARSLRLHKNIINQTLRLAQKNGLLLKNPCEFVSIPKTQRYESTFYTAEQMHALFEAIRDDELFPLIKITALYGLRRSEALGLKWDSINFDEGFLTIRHTVVKASQAVAKDKTKNASSYRSFPLTNEAREIFQQAKENEKENRKLFGKGYQSNDYVFKWADGHPFAPDYVTRRFSRLLEKNGLPHIRFHELRHSCASLLINAGFTLKDVQEWLGHADIKMTANVYGHLDVSRKRDMASKLTGSFSAEC